jgi:hypothetical protein
MGLKKMPTMITTTPFARINDSWCINDATLNTLLSTFSHETAYTNFNDNYSIHNADPELHQRAFLHVVTETIFNYPHNANGEKTMKPIACYRPFVLVCVPGALQDLKDLGFKTFSNWWCEDYDLIIDPVDRLYAILDVVKWVCGHDVSDLTNLLSQMQPVLEHNYNHYYNTLLSEQTKIFDQACRKNLKPR